MATAEQAQKRGHIVAIRKGGALVGYQLRLVGPHKESCYFSVSKWGSARHAMRGAKSAAKSVGVALGLSRGGSEVGRRTCRSKTPAAGIGFRWIDYTNSTVLYITASWTDKKGRLRGAKYSVEANGLDGALNKAIKARTSAGAPMPNRAALSRAIVSELRSRA